MFVCPFQQFLLYRADGSSISQAVLGLRAQLSMLGNVAHPLCVLGLRVPKRSQLFWMPLSEGKTVSVQVGKQAQGNGHALQ